VLKGKDHTYKGVIGGHVDVELEVQNQTKWPWKKNTYLSGAKDVETPFKFDKVVLVNKVDGLQNFKIHIPVGIPSSIDHKHIGNNELALQFFQEKDDKPVGKSFTVNIEVAEK